MTGSLVVLGTSIIAAAAARVISLAPGGETMLVVESGTNGNRERRATLF